MNPSENAFHLKNLKLTEQPLLMPLFETHAQFMSAAHKFW